MSDPKRQVLEELLKEATARREKAKSEFAKWRVEFEQSSEAVNTFEYALKIYLDSIAPNLFPPEPANNGNDQVKERDEGVDDVPIADINDELLYGKSFTLRSVFHNNRNKGLNLDGILKALPPYSVIDRAFLHRMLPRFITRGELTRDADGFFWATEKLTEPERRIGARVKV